MFTEKFWKHTGDINHPDEVQTASAKVLRSSVYMFNSIYRTLHSRSMDIQFSKKSWMKLLQNSLISSFWLKKWPKLSDSFYLSLVSVQKPILAPSHFVRLSEFMLRIFIVTNMMMSIITNSKINFFPSNWRTLSN